MRGTAAGLLSALALALCLAGALAGDEAPAAASASAADAADVQRKLLRRIAELEQKVSRPPEDVQRELLRRIAELEQKVSEQSEASSRAALRALGPTGAPLELAEAGNHTGKRVACEGKLTEQQCHECHGNWKDGQCNFFHDKLVAAFKVVKHFAAEYIGPALLSDTMFYLAVVMVLQWHVRFHLGIWLSEHVYGPRFTLREVKPMMTLRRLGLNILILGIYYDESLPGALDKYVAHRPFACSIGLVFLDTVVIYYIFMALGTFLNRNDDFELREWVNPLDENEDDGLCPEKFEADNVYEDLTIKFRRALPIWLIQIGLVMFYIEELNSNKETKNRNYVDFIYWIVAVMFQMHAGDDQVGEAFNTKFWMHILKKKSFPEQFKECILGLREGFSKDGDPLLNKEERVHSALQNMELPRQQAEKLRQLLKSVTNEDCLVLKNISDKDIRDSVEDPEASGNSVLFRKINAVLKDDALRDECLEESLEHVGSLWHKVFWILDMKFELEWRLRCFMDFTVNSVARNIILYTVPIMVCVEGPLDFVKDLTAVMFITTLDNIDGEPKDIAEILAKLKYAIDYSKDFKSNWTSLREAFGADVEVPTQEVCLNIFEKDYIRGHQARFDRLADLAGEDWKAFRLKGIPIAEEEWDAQGRGAEGNARACPGM